MTFSSNVEWLYSATNLETGEEYLFSDLDGSMEEPLSRSNAAFPVIDRDGAYDPRGRAANPLDGRTIHIEYAMLYDASNSFTTRFDTFMRVVGHGRAVRLKKVTSLTPVTYRIGYGKFLGTPKPITSEQRSIIRFDLSFFMADPLWEDEFATGWKRWDSIYGWDQANLTWDDNPDSFALTTNRVAHTLVYPGSAENLVPIITIVGPYPGTINVVNESIPLGSTFYSFVYIGSLGTRIDPVSGTTVGDQLIVDCGRLSITKNGVSVYANGVFGFTPGQETWMKLVYGNNLLYVTSSGGGTMNGRCEIFWKPKYA